MSTNLENRVFSSVDDVTGEDSDATCQLRHPVTKKSCVMGIDEAGRGPVLGPMVYCGFLCATDDCQYLKSLKVDDSKQLTEARRDEMYSTLRSEQHRERFAWYGEVLSPNYLSNSMLGVKKYNLNEISHDTAIAMIRRAIGDGYDVEEVFVDTVGPAEKYEAKLSTLFPAMRCTVRSKADSLFACVSAASIVAKVTRDKCLAEWRHEEQLAHDTINELPFGCGYPSDDVTKKFMEGVRHELFGFPTLVRFGWSTAFNVIKRECMSVKWVDDGDSSDGKLAKKSTVKSKDVRAMLCNAGNRSRSFRTYNDLANVYSEPAATLFA